MKYEVQKDKIIIHSTDEFKPKDILECGQIFCYKKNNDNYVVYSLDKKAEIVHNGKNYEILTKNTEYFVNFFDLNTNYCEIKQNLLNSYPYLNNALKYGSGIRILKQDPFETIISFIISSNNNIKRIQKILFAIREKFGNKIEDYYTFPTVEQLLLATEQDFKNLGAGYRSKYLEIVVKQLSKIDLNSLNSLSTEELNKELLKLMGVGQKVADCIMLFGFGRGDVFPVDTWIEKVYCAYFEEEHDRVKIRRNLVNMFKQNSGYAQQYLFYSQRENS